MTNTLENKNRCFGLNCVTPIVTLFGNRVIADIIEMRSQGSRVGSYSSIIYVFIREKINRVPCD